MAKQQKKSDENEPKAEIKKPMGKKQIADAVLYDKNSSNGQASKEEFSGDANMPPIELSEEENKRLATQALEKELQAKAITDSTTKYHNDINIWRLISKTENKILGWNNVVTAMKVGNSRGVLVCVKESHNDNATISTTFIQNAVLEERNGKWTLL